MPFYKLSPAVVDSTLDFTFNNVTATGNLISLNANLGNIATANYFVGNFYGAANTAGTVTTNAQPNITSVGSLSSLIVSNATGVINFINTANVSLGAVANLKITGGTTGQYLKTDGTGNLSWANVTGGGGGGTSITYTASTTPPGTANVADQWYNTSTNTLYEYLNDGSANYWVDIQTPTTATSNSNTLYNVAGYLNRTYTGTGSQTNFTITSGLSASAVIVVQDGVVQTPTTDYTVSGVTLTFVTAPANGSTIQIRELGFAIPITPVSSAAGSNTQIQYNNQGFAAGSNGLLFNNTSNTLTTGNVSVSGNVTTGNLSVSGTTSFGNLTVTNNTTTGNLTTVNISATGNLAVTGNAIVSGNVIISGTTNLGTATNLLLSGGTAGQVLTSNGAGGVNFANASSGGASRAAAMTMGIIFGG